MIIIAHRGNIQGPVPHLENDPSYINQALELGYSSEIDLWFHEGKLSLGHDEPEYVITMDWLTTRSRKLYIHAKDLNTIEFLKNKAPGLNFFFHGNDDCTITSRGDIWVHPNSKPIRGSIFVMPELSKFTPTEIKEAGCFGVCTDFVNTYQ